MSVFDGIETAQLWENKGAYLPPGSYDLEVVALKAAKTRKGEAFFAADLKVLGTSNKDVTIGAIHNWFTGAKHDSFLSNVKSFVVALLSANGTVIDPTQINADVMDSLVDRDGATVAGSRIRCDVRLVDTKSGGKFSAHVWRAAGATAAPAKEEQVANTAPAGEQQAAAN